MTFIVDGTNGLTFNNSTTQASAGVVLQVVQATTTSAATTTSTSYVTTGFSASVTPKFSTSKILITVSSTAVNSAGANMRFTVYRNSTPLDSGGNGLTILGSASIIPVNITYLDSPATTSSTTYTVYFFAPTGTSTFGTASTTSSITLMEIAA